MKNGKLKIRFLSFFIVAIIMVNSELAAWAKTDNSSFNTLQTFGDLLLPDVTQVTVGAGIEVSPDYFGSNDYKVGPKFDFYVRIDNYLSLGTDGASLNILGKRKFQFGPVLNITGKRTEDRNSVLNGLGDIKRSIDIGLFGKIILSDRYSIKVRVFNDLIGSDNGALVDVSLNAIVYEKGKLSIAAGVKGSWIGKKRSELFFGISPEQSQLSGLPVYTPGTTVSDVQFDIGARWQFADNWAINGYTQYARLLGNVARSPIVTTFGSPDQLTVGAYFTYTFQFK